MTPATQAPFSPWVELMTRALAHSRAHGAQVPVLSPVDRTVVAFTPPLTGMRKPRQVPVERLHAIGVRVIPWTTNDPEHMRLVIRSGVDGLISDRPDLLQKVLAEERLAHPDDARLKSFVVSAHRGGRGLRPENTLPSFESGLDQLSTELETDTGVSTDGVSLIWHDQFYNPQSCRRADGQPYTDDNRVFLRDISSTDAQKIFICDKLRPDTAGPEQKNDPALSPVSVAFSALHHRPNIYTPTYAEELFRFVAFYAEFYSTGAGRGLPHAAERARNAQTVRFNLETKILPDAPPGAALPPGMEPNHTVSPQAFVDALAGVIMRNHMESRAEIQSFDFRTLQLVEEQFPRIPTYYLTEDGALLSSGMVPAGLRAPLR